MTFVELKELLKECQNMVENDEIVSRYLDEYIAFLRENAITPETINLAINTVTIDQGANFIDYFSELDKREITDFWKVLSNASAFKTNRSMNAFEFLCAFVSAAIFGEKNCILFVGRAVSAMPSKCTKKDGSGFEETTVDMVLEYIIRNVREITDLPMWEKMKVKSNGCIRICKLFDYVMSDVKVANDKALFNKVRILKQWIEQGYAYAEKLDEENLAEQKKTIKKSAELKKLSEYFSELEDKLESCEMKITELQQEIEALEHVVGQRNTTINELNNEIAQKDRQIALLESSLSQSEKQVEERKKLNEAQVKYRINSQESLLVEIGKSLAAEYEDYEATKHAPMSEMLGEIYRAKLENVFMILERKGIRANG